MDRISHLLVLLDRNDQRIDVHELRSENLRDVELLDAVNRILPSDLISDALLVEEGEILLVSHRDRIAINFDQHPEVVPEESPVRSLLKYLTLR